MKPHNPFETLEWEEGDWAITSYRLVWSRNYLVYHKGEAIAFANSVVDGVEYIMREQNEQQD